MHTFVSAGMGALSTPTQPYAHRVSSVPLLGVAAVRCVCVRFAAG